MISGKILLFSLILIFPNFPVKLFLTIILILEIFLILQLPVHLALLILISRISFKTLTILKKNLNLSLLCLKNSITYLLKLSFLLLIFFRQTVTLRCRLFRLNNSNLSKIFHFFHPPVIHKFDWSIWSWYFNPLSLSWAWFSPSLFPLSVSSLRQFDWSTTGCSSLHLNLTASDCYLLNFYRFLKIFISELCYFCWTFIDF